MIMEDLQRGGEVLRLLEFMETLPLKNESDGIISALQILEKHTPGKWKKYDGYTEADYNLNLQSSVPNELDEMEKQENLLSEIHKALSLILSPSQYFVGSSLGIGIAHNIRSGQSSAGQYIGMAKNDDLSNVASLIDAGLAMDTIEPAIISYVTKYRSLPKESEYHELDDSPLEKN